MGRKSNKIKLVCRYCGKAFKVIPSRSIGNKKAKYCSRKCRDLAHRNRVTKICQYCGKSFKVIASAIKYGGGKYHNQKCFRLATSNFFGKYIRTEIIKNKMREATIKHLSSGKKIYKDTSIEIAIENELKRVNLNYQKQIAICKVGIVDFFLPEHNVIIECDGDYFHNLSEHKKRDATKNLIWSFNGYKVFRFWEHEIKDSPKKCIKMILKYLSR